MRRGGRETRRGGDKVTGGWRLDSPCGRAFAGTRLGRACAPCLHGLLLTLRAPAVRRLLPTLTFPGARQNTSTGLENRASIFATVMLVDHFAIIASWCLPKILSKAQRNDRLETYPTLPKVLTTSATPLLRYSVSPCLRVSSLLTAFSARAIQNARAARM